MKTRRFIKQLLLTFFISSILTLALNILWYGMPVFGKPDPDRVSQVVVKDIEAGEEKEITEAEDIGIACKLLNFLNYVPFSNPDERISPVIEITYTLSDGRELTASANYSTGWWKGRAYTLKDDTAFVNIARGVCFPMYDGQMIKTHG